MPNHYDTTTQTPTLDVPEIFLVKSDQTNQPFSPGSECTDSTPELLGRGTPGSTITVMVDGEPVGTAVVDSYGEWSFMIPTTLQNGSHQFTATAELSIPGAESIKSAPSSSYQVQVNAEAATEPQPQPEPQPESAYQQPVSTPEITQMANDHTYESFFSGSQSSDNTPQINGRASPGASITVMVDGKPLGTTVADFNGNWQFNVTTPLENGTHHFTATAELPDANGNPVQSDASQSFELEIAAKQGQPSEPQGIEREPSLIPSGGLETPQILSAQGDNGDLKSGDQANNSTPTLQGLGNPGDRIAIYDNGKFIGEVEVKSNGGWQFSPMDKLSGGEHHFTASVIDDQGNSTNKTSPTFTLNTPEVDTQQPTDQNYDNINLDFKQQIYSALEKASKGSPILSDLLEQKKNELFNDQKSGGREDVLDTPPKDAPFDPDSAHRDFDLPHLPTVPDELPVI
ncbi:Ig-like domain-containing protein [Ewingella allii]|uniref:Ig-like domain-containing protein n=1 Tax=Ewingella allii TaxID=3092550 RepID=UPI0037B4244D